MSISTTSYFLIPIIPNPFKRYEVDSQRKLRIVGIVGETENIPLGGISSKIVRGKWLTFLMNYAFGTGNLVLTGSPVGSSGLTLKNLYGVKRFKRAIDGELLDNSTDTSETEIEKPKERKQLTDDDIQQKEILYFPHIPKTIRILLESLESKTYNYETLKFLAKEGDFVLKRDVIARYGKIELTAPFDGKIISLGSQETGRYDWPDLEKTSDIIMHSPNQDIRLFYAFAISPSKDVYLQGSNKTFGVRYSFNHGEVWLDMKRSTGYTFYTYIDLAVYDLKSPGSGIELPDTLKDDEDFKKQLMKYWPLINNGDAFNPKHVSKTTETNAK